MKDVAIALFCIAALVGFLLYGLPMVGPVIEYLWANTPLLWAATADWIKTALLVVALLRIDLIVKGIKRLIMS